jgi:hypothetical protein
MAREPTPRFGDVVCQTAFTGYRNAPEYRDLFLVRAESDAYLLALAGIDRVGIGDLRLFSHSFVMVSRLRDEP